MEAAGGPVELPDLAAACGCSARQLQRDFSDAIGVTPREYGQSVRTLRARTTLRSSGRVSDAIYDAGYGSVRAFYEEAGQRLGMTPSRYASGGVAVPLLWSITPSAIGWIIAVASAHGLCAVRIGTSTDALTAEIVQEFATATLRRDDEAMADVMRALRAIALGEQVTDLPIDVRGTAFQARVWRALEAIPAGQTRTYTEVAERIGSPTSVRAVARACASNRVALAVPCHRVIARDGSLAGYAWGLAVKAQLLENESAGRKGR